MHSNSSYLLGSPPVGWYELLLLEGTPMKRISLEVQLGRLDPALSASIRDHINKMQNFQQDILHASKEISVEDMAITLLSHLVPLLGLLLISYHVGRLSTITWEELVPMVFDQEEQFIRPFPGTVEALIAQKPKPRPKGIPGTNDPSASSSDSIESRPPSTCNHCGTPGNYWHQCPYRPTPETCRCPCCCIHVHGHYSHPSLCPSGTSWVLITSCFP